jgi:hypothetical protein
VKNVKAQKQNGSYQTFFQKVLPHTWIAIDLLVLLALGEIVQLATKFIFLEKANV